MTSLVELRNVSKLYDDGSVAALRGVDLTVGRGEFIVISGQSGSGKSSLIHLMAGFDAPSSGTVSFEGEIVRQQRVWTELRRTRIGVIFQEFLLLPTLTALENVEMALAGSGLSGAAQRARAAEHLESFGLKDRMTHLPHALSGGERQRVAIARSIIHRPVLLLADEPTGNLDSDNARMAIELLVGIQKSSGMTLAMVTHDHSIAELGHRRIRIKDGRIVEDAIAKAGAPTS